MQSSRKRFGLEHREGDLCWSLSESEGRKEKVIRKFGCLQLPRVSDAQCDKLVTSSVELS